MSNVIKFQRYVTFVNPSIRQLQDYVRENGWTAFRADWDRFVSDNIVVLERLPR
jgi:hypothetical protein